MDAPRARGAFALRAVMRSPWSLRILAESPITLIAGVTGELWVVPDHGEPTRVGPGDIAVTGDRITTTSATHRRQFQPW